MSNTQEILIIKRKKLSVIELTTSNKPMILKTKGKKCYNQAVFFKLP